jgi:hypothetical protein
MGTLLMSLLDERIYTNNTITINLEVVLYINFDMNLFGDLQVVEDLQGKPKSFSINSKEYSPVLCFKEVTEGNQVLISNKDINNVLGLQIQAYTDNCSITFKDI